MPTRPGDEQARRRAALDLELRMRDSLAGLAEFAAEAVTDSPYRDCLKILSISPPGGESAREANPTPRPRLRRLR